jgi:hypothetical protein
MANRNTAAKNNKLTANCQPPDIMKWAVNGMATAAVSIAAMTRRKTAFHLLMKRHSRRTQTVVDNLKRERFIMGLLYPPGNNSSQLRRA